MKSDLTQNNSAFRIPHSALKNPQKAEMPFAGLLLFDYSSVP